MQSKSRHEASSYIFGPMTIIMLDASDRNMLLACKEKTQISIKKQEKESTYKTIIYYYSISNWQGSYTYNEIIVYTF